MPGRGYNGELANGQRNGVGNLNWADGSKFEGQWANNLRHGNGKYEYGGKTFIGQYQQDLRHGRGCLTKKNGNIIKGTWVNDKLNGLASVQENSLARKNYAIFKDGMEI